MTYSARIIRGAAALVVLPLVSCVESPTAGIAGIAGVAGITAHATSGATLVECPTNTSATATALITPLGGVVSAGGSSISVPAGAVLLPTSITVTVPASNYMEIAITANGGPHFEFLSPVTVSIAYTRCTRTDIDKTPLAVWYIDSATKALLEPMGGSDDKAARTVTFTTDHLSGYAIAN